MSFLSVDFSAKFDAGIKDNYGWIFRKHEKLSNVPRKLSERVGFVDGSSVTEHIGNYFYKSRNLCQTINKSNNLCSKPLN